LLLHYWYSGDLNLLIHPAYHGLTVITGVGLLILSIGQGFSLLRFLPSRPSHSPRPVQLLSALLLTLVAGIGLMLPLKISGSSYTTDRPVTDFLSLARLQPTAFRVNLKPEDRTIMDWVRTFNVYPEPDAYQGDGVKLEGFVLHPADLPDNYLLIARFVITCCAADIYPVGLPVLLQGSRAQYPVDQWIRLEGSMTTATLNGQRKAVIQPKTIVPIPQPKNPYIESRSLR
jgi:uncharacterized repeat protein (TIGR03943 family)